MNVNAVGKLRLLELADDRRDAVLSIQLHDHQVDYLPSIQSSLEMAERYPNSRSLVFDVDGSIVGYGLYGIDDETGAWKIFRLYIDKNHQSKGFGRAAMQLLLQQLEDDHGASEVLIVYNGDNKAAEHLYQSIGFVPYAHRDDKVLARYDCSTRIYPYKSGARIAEDL